MDFGEMVLTKEQWENAIIRLQNCAEDVAEVIRHLNYNGDGDYVANYYLGCVAVACAAMDFVKENAIECVRFLPVDLSDRE